MPEERFRVDAGKGQVSAAYDRPPKAIATIVVAHGAGAGMDHPFMVGFTREINELGVATLRFNFPYMEAKRRSPDPAPVAIAAWRAVFEAAVARAKREPVWASGKSFGGRMASMAAAEGMDAAGLVFLGYPLHAPATPDKIRAEHLADIKVPMLFIEGTQDPFARQDRLAPVLKSLGKRATLHTIQGGDHSFNVRGDRRDARDVGASLAPIAAEFIRTHV